MHIHKSLAEKEQVCKELLRSTGRDKIEDLINHIERMGYFVAPGSHAHHRFKGGLVSHSLELYEKAMELRDQYIKNGTDEKALPKESIIIAALMHDLCKADSLRFSEVTRKIYSIKKTHGHGTRSVRQVGYSGFRLTKDEKDAILWHMGGCKIEQDKQKRDNFFQTHPLASIIRSADGRSIAIAKNRHHSDKHESKGDGR